MAKTILIFCCLFGPYLVFAPELGWAQSDIEAKSEELAFEDMTNQMAEMQKQLEQYQKLIKQLDSPAMRTLTKIGTDKKVQEQTLEVYEKLNWRNIGISQVILLVIFFAFRNWRQSKATHWVGRFWVSLYSWVIYMACATYFLPRLIVGRPFGRLAGAIYDILKSS